ncbi:Rossmann-like and DUF2520 domain-containing protein [Rhodoferax aquaticus]|uniref:DUF2520 domain-containing protein n=1 Tax=Rhodoferax aquaticus TaxID=2527691 RepID=A0A515EKM0_9BURK|nr:Rossmann-like and DUF2520 domain-containing protein [Rhodoferax aquaticus]QDL53212.1 DUF2520 domain-containing protein [Rhodoferax aquaticus]
MQTQTLNIVGAGRVGQTLAHLWHQHGVFTVQDVLTTRPDTAQAACAFIGAGTACTSTQALRPADVWMLATPDARLPEAITQLEKRAPDLGTRPPAPLVFHCSGALDSGLLLPLQVRGWQVASAHCILSFATPTMAVQQFAGTPCALEGNSPSQAKLQTAFEAIGAQCFEIRKEDKLLYHAAAVFATNFLPVLQSVAEEAWRAVGVPELLLPHLRASLLHNAVTNILALGPQKALTGPAARGDLPAIERQAQAVRQWDAPSGAAYEALSQLALRLAGKA